MIKTTLFKKITICIIVFLIIFMPISNASGEDERLTIEHIISKGDEFLEEGKNGAEETVDPEEAGGIGKQPIIDDQELKKQINLIYNLVSALGISISVIVGSILGIKYMVGSVEEQAKIKETFIPYALGCVIVFGAFGIWKIAMEVGGKIF